MKELDYEIVTSDNINSAIKIQNEIFADEDGKLNLKQSIDKDFLEKTMNEWNVIKYFLVKIENRPIGIVGYYSYKLLPDDAWIGWYGIIESERGKNMEKRF